ncbi:glutathione peroxidase [Chamberlinius hualienensis]
MTSNCKTAILLLILATVVLAKPKDVLFEKCNSEKYGNETIFDFSLLDIYEKNLIDLSKYREKVLVVVNVATYCGLTKQYIPFNVLQTNYSAEVAVLGFPCNQFALQEPGENPFEIMNGIKYIRPGHGFVPNFQLFKKGDVNGKKEQPIYTFLKKHCPPPQKSFANKYRIYHDEFHQDDIRWNWEKFIINRQGVPVYRINPSVAPEDFIDKLEEVINLH